MLSVDETFIRKAWEEGYWNGYGPSRKRKCNPYHFMSSRIGGYWEEIERAWDNGDGCGTSDRQHEYI